MPTTIDVQRKRPEQKPNVKEKLKQFARAGQYTCLGAAITLVAISWHADVGLKDLIDTRNQLEKIRDTALAQMNENTALLDGNSTKSASINRELDALQLAVNATRMDLEFALAASKGLCDLHEKINVGAMRYYNPEYKARLIEAAGERGCFSLKLTP